MEFLLLPKRAAWRHGGLRDGFEVVFAHAAGPGYRLEGHTTAVEAGEAWVVQYEITVDERWVTTTVRVQSWTSSGEQQRTLTSDGAGHWKVDGEPAHDLDGCMDIDLESSACTNTLPLHRLGLDVGERADAPAAYVRVLDLDVERLEQQYTCIAASGEPAEFDYRAPTYDYAGRLTFDRAGLVVEYPGVAARAL